jgi:hypothetical protein
MARNNSRRPRKIPVAEMQGGSLPVVLDLPSPYYEGIGKVASAHAFLESRMQEFLFDLMAIDYPIGRVVFEYGDPARVFGSIRKLLDLWGIEIKQKLLDAETQTKLQNLEQFETEIRSHSRQRNNLVHCVWMTMPDGQLALRVTEGQYQTDQGIHDRAFLPQPNFIPVEWFNWQRELILRTTKKLMDIQTEVKPQLAALLERQRASSPPSNHSEDRSHQEPLPQPAPSQA